MNPTNLRAMFFRIFLGHPIPKASPNDHTIQVKHDLSANQNDVSEPAEDFDEEWDASKLREDLPTNLIPFAMKVELISNESVF